jgi:hypothetical protein
LTPERLQTLWTDLASDDAARAARSLWRLVGAPAQTVPFLRTHLRPAASADPQRITRLIAELGSDRFTVRDKATQELLRLDENALPQLREAKAGQALEQARRIEQLVAKLQAWTPARLQALRAIEVLEQIGNSDARLLLQALADGAEALLTREARAALVRLSKREAKP